MKQSISKKRRVWFWVGAVLLSLSALWWALLIVSGGDMSDTVVAGIVTTIIPVGLGIYGIWRGNRLEVSKEMICEQIVSVKDPDTFLRQGEKTIARHRADQLSRFAWLIVIAFPISAIVIAAVFEILKLPVLSLILTLLVTFFICFLLLGIVSKHQSINYKKSSSSDLERKRH